MSRLSNDLDTSIYNAPRHLPVHFIQLLQATNVQVSMHADDQKKTVLIPTK
jgi:hypothetical protein